MQSLATNRKKAPDWTKEAALAELKALVDAVPALGRVRRLSGEHTRWLARTLRILEEVFGQSSRYYLGLERLPWKETEWVALDGVDPKSEIEDCNQRAYLRQLDTARGWLLAAIDDLKSSSIDAVYKGKDSPRESSEIVTVLLLLEHKLRKVIRQHPEKEKEIQDAVENLLVAADIAYSRDNDSIEYSSKTYVPDFTLPRIDLAIEVKLSTRKEREKEIIGEINDDIMAYQTKYRNILFVVYDTGFIRDVDRFVSHFEQYEGVLIRVVKH